MFSDKIGCLAIKLVAGGFISAGKPVSLFEPGFVIQKGIIGSKKPVITIPKVCF